MRLPTSVIVMSLVTATPFGLAIRDTLNTKQLSAGLHDPYFGDPGGRSAGRDDAENEAYEEYMRERELERELEAQADAKRQQEKLARLHELHGKRVASMGSLLDGIALGAPVESSVTDGARQRIERARQDGIDVQYDTADSLWRVQVMVEDSYDPASGELVDVCSTLRDKLTAAWGPSTGGVWVDSESHRRARLEQEPCALMFDFYLDASEWLAAASPTMLGKPLAPILEEYGGKLGVSAGSYSVPGLGAGVSDTQVTVDAVRGKTTSFDASTNADYDSVIAVRDKLTAQLKVKPVATQDADEDGTAERWTWKLPGRRTVDLSYSSSGTLWLHAGK